MEETRFGLHRRPFPNTPDSSAYYAATGHELALEGLGRALADGEGVCVLTGAAGTGKTLVCQCLLERLGDDAVSAFLTNSHLPDRTGLLQAVLYEFSLPHLGVAEQGLRLALTEFLLNNFAQGKRAVLVVDEAQHLTVDVLEELRLLGNLEARRGKALQVVLVGQPGLLATLDRPELSALRQRIAVRLSLEALDVHEAADYLLHHLRVAGVRPTDLFTDEAVDVLARSTRGLPRLLNQAAHLALHFAARADAMPVDAEAALEALDQLGLEAELTGELPAFADARGEDDAEGLANGHYPPSDEDGESGPTRWNFTV